MFRDKEEELQRLEQLLAQVEEEETDESDEEYDEAYEEESETDFSEEDFDEEDLIAEFSSSDDDASEFDREATQIFSTVPDLKMYNADRCDVELEAFSEDVYAGPRKPVLPWVFVALTVVVLLVLYLALKQGGYL